MLIRLDDHANVADLCDHYTRSGFAAECVGGGMIEVTRPDAPTQDQGRREIELHLRVWQIANPGLTVDVC
jgi:hypothetical protein